MKEKVCGSGDFTSCLSALLYNVIIKSKMLCKLYK